MPERLAIGLFALLAAASVVCAADLPSTDLFVGGKSGYKIYRIPALVVTRQGVLLAFCEGRRDSTSDTGKIDMLLKRSTNGGRTWSERQVIWCDRENTCGNPCPVVDAQTGKVWLLMTWNRGDDTENRIIAQTSKDTRRVYVTHSEDDGLTWAPAKEITRDVKAPDWTWIATGPGNGIQLHGGPKQDRLVIPCYHNEAKTRKVYSHVMYSDDHGVSWRLGGSSPRDRTDESAVVELADGRLMLNMRNYDGSQRRAVCLSADGGQTWTGQYDDPALVEPNCQASMVRYRWDDERNKSCILFSNPASSVREKLTVRLSYDEGRTWPVARLLHGGPASYSSLAALPDGSFACLYEGGKGDCREQKIVFARATFDWLSGGVQRGAADSEVTPGLVMDRYTIARDDKHHLGWPMVCLAANGDLVCSYAVGDTHGGGAVPQAVVRISKDLGRTWSEPVVVETLHVNKGEGFMMCRWVSRLRDDSLLLAADWLLAKPKPAGSPHNWPNDPENGGDKIRRAWLYRSVDDGRSWVGPEKTRCMTVSLTMKQTNDGTLFLTGSLYRTTADSWRQVVYRSTDNGRTWSDPITILDDLRYCPDEGSIVEMPGPTLVIYERTEKVIPGAIKMISDDGGQTWKGPFAAGHHWINGRVCAGRLSSGEVLVVHRTGSEHFAFFVETAETAMSRVPYNAGTYRSPALNWGLIDVEHHQPGDGGYGGWVELPDGNVYAVNYITDDAPKPQIRGYRLSRKILLKAHP